MARPSEDRIEGYHCENHIKKGKRKGQMCGKLLFAKNGLTIWDERCESTHSLLDLLRKAIDLRYLTLEDVLGRTPELCHQQLNKEKVMLKSQEIAEAENNVITEIAKLAGLTPDELEKIKSEDGAKTTIITIANALRIYVLHLKIQKKQTGRGFGNHGIMFEENGMDYVPEFHKDEDGRIEKIVFIY